MKARIAAILERAISEWIELGIGRAHKHTNTPGNPLIAEQVDRAIWEKIDEVLDLSDEDA